MSGSITAERDSTNSSSVNSERMRTRLWYGKNTGYQGHGREIRVYQEQRSATPRLALLIRHHFRLLVGDHELHMHRSVRAPSHFWAMRLGRKRPFLANFLFTDRWV